MKFRVLPLLAAAAMACAPLSAAKAASVDIDVDITLPQILILYCYSDVNVNIPGSVLADIVEPGGALTFAAEGTGGVGAGDSTKLGDAGTVNATLTGSDVEVDLDAENVTVPSLATGTYTLTLTDICAVRGLSTTGTTASLTATGPATLVNGTSSIDLANYSVVATDGTVNLSLGTVDALTVSADLGLANVTAPGTHSSTTDVTVTATLP